MDNFHICEFTIQPLDNSFSAILCNNQTKDEVKEYFKLLYEKSECKFNICSSRVGKGKKSIYKVIQYHIFYLFRIYFI